LTPATTITDAVHNILIDTVGIECKFLTEALPMALLGMNLRLMVQDIESVADHLLLSLGNPKHYNSTKPFDFMESISLNGKINIFKKRIGNYQKAGVFSNAKQVPKPKEDTAPGTLVVAREQIVDDSGMAFDEDFYMLLEWKCMHGWIAIRE
jgi:ribonucleoside-diphosphate reductase subunit M2